MMKMTVRFAVSLAGIFCLNAADAQTGNAALGRMLKPVGGSVSRELIQYNGTEIVKRTGFKDSRLRTDGATWESKWQVRPNSSVENEFDATVSFALVDGNATASAVALSFGFSHWSRDNYVLIPASLYNGNRYRAIGNGYNPDYPKDMYYNPKLPLTISNNPRLAIENDRASLVELQTGNAATPAMCFYSPRCKRGFIFLTEQRTSWGNNGLKLEENARQDSCIFTVTIPSVRKMAAGFGDFHPSGDMAPDWKAGDAVSLHFKVYVFKANGIPDLLDKFFRVRKAVTGANHPRNQLPMSKELEMGTDICSSNWRSFPVGSYYLPENSQDFQLGWVSGMMNTFPMLALDDDIERERVSQELDFVTGKLQGESGFFYGGITSDGKLRPEKMHPDYPAIQSMVRKNGDAFLWLLKHLMLLKAQGYAPMIKKEWEGSTRRLADAFCRTWAKYGEFGQYIVPKTGDIAVFNSTAGAVVPAALAIAADYFHQPAYLQVARNAALYYFNRDVVKQGITGGDCGDISQDANSESAFAFLESLVTLYDYTGDRHWLERAKVQAALCASWTLSYDYMFPVASDIAKLDGKMAGAVWASIQNKHAAPGICTASGDCLFKLFRATGDHLYADLIRDIQHAQVEAVNRPGHLTTRNRIGSSMERIQPSDAEGKNGIGNFINTRNSWTETNGMIMALELPGVYVQYDSRKLYVFDHVTAKITGHDSAGITILVANHTEYDANVSVLAETLQQARQPLSHTAFVQWPKIAVKAGKEVTVRVTKNGVVLADALNFRTKYMAIAVSNKGYITSVKNVRTGKEYCPKGMSSALLSLCQDKKYILPEAARFDRAKEEINLSYPNGSVATVKVLQKQEYLCLKLEALTNSAKIDNIIWGPYKLTISKLIGDIFSVLRDGEFAVGMMGLDDNTTCGPPTDGDLSFLYYYVHSPDPVKFPLPAGLREGQTFPIGGDGKNDVAFFSQPEEYFRMNGGNGAWLEPSFGAAICMHSRDRRREQMIQFPHYPDNLDGKLNSSRYQLVTPADAGYIGSSMAFYGCPDSLGLKTIEKIVLNEGLPHPLIDGKWVKDPASYRPDIAWSGPHDSLASYALRLGIKGVQDEGFGEYYPNPANRWGSRRINFKGAPAMTVPEYGAEMQKNGIRYGLHTLCEFLQPDNNSDVSPVPSDSLAIMQRTILTKDISPEDTVITVRDTAHFNEFGGWEGNQTNVLKIGKELIEYDGISRVPPYTFLHIKRGFHRTVRAAHRAGSTLVKLQPNCYQGFAPDISLQDLYADYYGKWLTEGKMNYIDFDGLESCMYQGHGQYSFKRFFGKLFDSYYKNGGKYLRVMGSGIQEGSWHFMSVCNVGGGDHMFSPVLNKWGIEGKDIRYMQESSYFPATFGIQNLDSDWSLYDAENLEAKSIGFNATYMLGLNQQVVEANPAKDAIFSAIGAWEKARVAAVFDNGLKERLKDLSFKYHLAQIGESKFVLTPIKEFRKGDIPYQNTAVSAEVENLYAAQPMDMALRIHIAGNDSVDGIKVTVPGLGEVVIDRQLKNGMFVIGRGNELYVADGSRRKMEMVAIQREMVLPSGKSTFAFAALHNSNTKVTVELVVWMKGTPESICRPESFAGVR
jgi:hypothetical protein